MPARAGVLLVEMRAAGAEPYLLKTADLRRAAERLLRAPEEASKRLNLRAVAAGICYRATGSKFEQTLVFYQHAKANFPGRYSALLRLRGPALLKVNLRNAYPRCYATRRIRADEGFYFGPFISRRAADAFAEGFLDLFKIRRCQIKIRRDPTFPGCIYSEMKMCLAPCFAGCTKDEYDAEVGRVLEALASTGEALTTSLEREREAASEALDFERAAALHKRLEKVSAALRGLPELARRVQDLDAVILERAAEEKTVAGISPARRDARRADFLALRRNPVHPARGVTDPERRVRIAVVCLAEPRFAGHITRQDYLRLVHRDHPVIWAAPAARCRWVSPRSPGRPGHPRASAVLCIPGLIRPGCA